MIELLKTFDLKSETRDLVIVANEKKQTQLLLDLFDQPLKTFSDELFSSVYTLGKLKAKKVHIIGQGKLKDEKNLKKIISKLSELKEDYLVLVNTFSDEEVQYLPLFVEKIMVTAYKLDTYKSKKSDDLPNVYLYSETDIEEQLNEGIIYGESINKAKDLVNTPYNYMRAKDLADYAKTLEKYDGIKVKIFEKKEIEGMNMGSFLGVNQGSSDDPYLIFIEYKKEGNKDEPTALVGKGVMYDTGGYSLKTPQSMPGMKVDMAGSAAVVSAIEGIARLGLDANVMSIVAATDNRIGDGAIVPDDVLTAASDKTIEIVSTDAEGRLTLADAVWFAQEVGAKRIIDVATLTGAILVSLAQYYTGAFTNNQTFYDEFKKVTEETKEDIWLMPVSKVFHDELKSKVADISNKGGRFGGSSIAAAFIEEFINEDTAWIHLDVAGTASNKKEGATGVMVKSFIKLFHK